MAHVFRTEWSEWNEFRCHDVSVRWIQHDLTSAVYPTLNLTNPMVTTPRNRIHQFMFVLCCISRGWRTIIHFNYYYTFFCKTATKRILHPMVTFTWWFGFLWFGILEMPPRWWWPVDGDDLRLLYESPHYLARAQGKKGYAGRCVLKISRNTIPDSNIRDFLHFVDR